MRTPGACSHLVAHPRAGRSDVDQTPNGPTNLGKSVRADGTPKSNPKPRVGADSPCQVGGTNSDPLIASADDPTVALIDAREPRTVWTTTVRGGTTLIRSELTRRRPTTPKLLGSAASYAPEGQTEVPRRSNQPLAPQKQIRVPGSGLGKETGRHRELQKAEVSVRAAHPRVRSGV